MRAACRSGKEDTTMYKTILFDLDGTLTDPGLGITNSIMYALEKFDIKVEDRTSLYKFIGPPLQESFKKYYDFSDEDITRAVAYYREYYSDKGIYENVLYDGMAELLEQIKNSGRNVVLATSKPEEFAAEILRYFDIAKHFDFLAGATMDGTRNNKADIIAYAIESYHITDLSSAVMVGDREYDILGANAAGLDSIGVLYGYGSLEELHNAGATHIAERVTDIMSFL